LYGSGNCASVECNALAQDTPTKFEVGVDYSYVHFIPALTPGNSQDGNGRGGSIVYYLHSSMPVLQPAPWSPRDLPNRPWGQFSTRGNLFIYMFGPVFKHRGKIQPYGQVLVGGGYSNLYGYPITAAGIAGASPNNSALP
jgi:hypothetical protein